MHKAHYSTGISLGSTEWKIRVLGLGLGLGLGWKAWGKATLLKIVEEEADGNQLDLQVRRGI